MAGIDDFNQIKSVLSALDTQKPARLGYTQQAIDATGAAEITALAGIYAPDDTTQINSIPTPDLIAIDGLIQEVGFRSQASTLSRLLINHFFGRLGLNLLKLTEKVKLLASDHLVNRYINSSGKIVENVTITTQPTTVNIVQNRSPLAAQVPTTETLTVPIPAAVHSGNAGVMTGADKAILDDTASGLATLNGAAVKLTGDQTVAGKKTFSTIPEGPASNPTTVNQLTRKSYVDAADATAVKLTGDQTVAGKKTFSTIPEGPESNPTTVNQLTRKSYVDTADATAVKLTGDQTVAGKKTFSSNPISSAVQGTEVNALTRKDYVDSIGVPVGAIVAYLTGYFVNDSNSTFMPIALTLPNGWKVCDGALCNDAQSPIFNATGRYLPNLTDSRFIMGSIAALAGGIGGNANNQVTLAIENLPSHVHTMNHTHSVTGTISSTNTDHSHEVGTFSSMNPWGQGSVSRPYMISGAAYATGTSCLSSGALSNQTHSHSFSSGVAAQSATTNTGSVGSGTAFSILPKYLTAAYIMRIK